MKLIRSDSRLLEVRDVGSVVCRLEAPSASIKCHGWHLLEDSEARALVRELAAAQRDPARRTPRARLV